MNRIFYILICVLILISSANAKEIYLNCESYKLISYRINGEIETGKGFPIEKIYKLNTAKKKVFKFMNTANTFIDISEDNLKWNKEIITWNHRVKKISEDHSAFITYSTLNRLNLELLKSTLYEDDKYFKKMDSHYRCNIVDKKF